MTVQDLLENRMVAAGYDGGGSKTTTGDTTADQRSCDDPTRRGGNDGRSSSSGNDGDTTTVAAHLAPAPAPAPAPEPAHATIIKDDGSTTTSTGDENNNNNVSFNRSNRSNNFKVKIKCDEFIIFDSSDVEDSGHAMAASTEGSSNLGVDSGYGGTTVRTGESTPNAYKAVAVEDGGRSMSPHRSSESRSEYTTDAAAAADDVDDTAPDQRVDVLTTRFYVEEGKGAKTSFDLEEIDQHQKMEAMEQTIVDQQKTITDLRKQLQSKEEQINKLRDIAIDQTRCHYDELLRRRRNLIASFRSRNRRHQMMEETLQQFDTKLTEIGPYRGLLIGEKGIYRNDPARSTSRAQWLCVVNSDDCANVLEIDDALNPDGGCVCLPRPTDYAIQSMALYLPDSSVAVPPSISSLQSLKNITLFLPHTMTCPYGYFDQVPQMPTLETIKFDTFDVLEPEPEPEPDPMRLNRPWRRFGDLTEPEFIEWQESQQSIKATMDGLCDFISSKCPNVQSITDAGMSFQGRQVRSVVAATFVQNLVRSPDRQLSGISSHLQKLELHGLSREDHDAILCDQIIVKKQLPALKSLSLGMDGETGRLTSLQGLASRLIRSLTVQGPDGSNEKDGRSTNPSSFIINGPVVCIPKLSLDMKIPKLSKKEKAFLAVVLHCFGVEEFNKRYHTGRVCERLNKDYRLIETTRKKFQNYSGGTYFGLPTFLYSTLVVELATVRKKTKNGKERDLARTRLFALLRATYSASENSSELAGPAVTIRSARSGPSNAVAGGRSGTRLSAKTLTKEQRNRMVESADRIIANKKTSTKAGEKKTGRRTPPNTTTAKPQVLQHKKSPQPNTAAAAAAVSVGGVTSRSTRPNARSYTATAAAAASGGDGTRPSARNKGSTRSTAPSDTPQPSTVASAYGGRGVESTRSGTGSSTSTMRRSTRTRRPTRSNTPSEFESESDSESEL